MAYNPHSSSSNLLSDLNGGLEGQISSDEAPSSRPPPSSQHLQPPSRSTPNPAPQTKGANGGDLEEQSIWKQSAHPVALLFLFTFRCAAIATYLLCGFFSSSYVFSVRRITLLVSYDKLIRSSTSTQTVLVVVLLSLDFWTVRNVSGRVLVGLRFWNQVDEDGTSFWVFESRSVSLSSNLLCL